MNLETTLLFVSGITSGQRYIFRYMGRNIHGDGLPSAELSVLAATVPTKMSAPTITLQSGAVYRASFVAPGSGGTNVAFAAYEVSFRTSDGTTYSTSSECTGSSLLTNTYCDVSLAQFTSTFGLVQGDVVVAKVRASNELGFGELSEQSTSLIYVVALPHALTAAPLRNSASSTTTSIAVDMPAVATGTTSGGIPITSYSLEWNGGGSGEVSWTSLVDDIATSYVKTGLTTGTMYKFRYLAKNDVGYSDPSPVMTTYAGTEPSQPAIPTTLIDSSTPTAVTITWTAPGDDGGLAVSSY